MKAEYILNVIMTPHFHDNANAPYFWCITSDGANNGCGWEATPEDAFSAGQKCMNKILDQMGSPNEFDQMESLD